MKKKIFIFTGIVLSSFVFYLCGHFLGQKDADADIARLNLLWPNYLSMPKDEKRLKIAKLATRSQLHMVDINSKRDIVFALMTQAEHDLQSDDPLLIELRQKYQQIENNPTRH